MDHKVFPLRLPVALHEALRERAKAEDRSMNAVVLRAVRQYLSRPPR